LTATVGADDRKVPGAIHGRKRGGVLNQWLRAAQRPSSAFTGFSVVDVTELGVPAGQVKEHLTQLLQASAADTGFLEDLARRLGWGTTEAIVRQRLTSNRTARRGRFGEVVGVNMLRQFDGYVIPIEKPHFMITGGQSQPSTDAVLFRVANGAIKEVCFVESKLRTRADGIAGAEGMRQLADDYAKQIPDMLTFTASRLYDQGSSLYDPFMEYMRSREDERQRDAFRLLLFYDVSAWSERCLANIEDDGPGVSPVTVHAVRVADLPALVNDVFARCGVQVPDDET
jgi:hypothetical protein